MCLCTCVICCDIGTAKEMWSPCLVNLTHGETGVLDPLNKSLHTSLVQFYNKRQEAQLTIRPSRAHTYDHNKTACCPNHSTSPATLTQHPTHSDHRSGHNLEHQPLRGACEGCTEREAESLGTQLVDYWNKVACLLHGRLGNKLATLIGQVTVACNPSSI